MGKCEHGVPQDKRVKHLESQWGVCVRCGLWVYSRGSAPTGWQPWQLVNGTGVLTPEMADELLG